MPVGARILLQHREHVHEFLDGVPGGRWFDHKWGTAKKEVRWTKLHIMVGVQTTIVTVADATPSQSADSPYLSGFVRATAEHFHIREVSADAVVDAGGVPYS